MSVARPRIRCNEKATQTGDGTLATPVATATLGYRKQGQAAGFALDFGREVAGCAELSDTEGDGWIGDPAELALMRSSTLRAPGGLAAATHNAIERQPIIAIDPPPNS